MADDGGEKRIRVVIVDDHVLVRSGLEVVLGMFDDIELVAQAGDGDEAVRLCRELSPDVVLMDLVMPGGTSGVDATKEVVASCPNTRVVALTSFGEDRLVHETLRAGAIGYLMKDVSADELAEAVRAAHAGRSTLAPEAADALVRSVSSPPPPAGLTARERQVLKLMADGLTNADIAERLVIGVATVKTHVSSIIAKLGVSTRTEASSLAIRRGLV